MSAPTLPPPRPPIVLTRPYKSRHIKGGTFIAEDVLDLKTHQERLLDPDGYRNVLPACPNCDHRHFHAHCFRERLLRPATPGTKVVRTTIRLYRCAHDGCGAVITVLPAIIARCLWRLWQTVEDVMGGEATAPKSTWRRWRDRLRCSASTLVELVLALAQDLLPDARRKSLEVVDTRQAFVHAFRSAGRVDRHPVFASLAAWIHRLSPGIRLM